MPKTVSIPLPEPITVHGKTTKQIVIREPDYDEYIACGGEPYTIGQSEDGIIFTIEKPEVIWAYAAVCIVEPDQLVLGTGDWRIAREVRKAIMGFFLAPAAGGATSGTSRRTSRSKRSSNSTPLAA